MKKLFFLLLFGLMGWAQVPQKMSFQAVLRNSSNTLLANTQVGIRVRIVQGSAQGNVVFAEAHSATTNANGLVSLQIGTGQVITGTMSAIDWSQGPYFIQTDTDPAGGTNYSLTGTTELLSVPYALAAGQSQPAPGQHVGDIQYWNGTTWVLLPIGSQGQILQVVNQNPQWVSVPQPALSQVATNPYSDLMARQVIMYGTVVNSGDEVVLTRGFCYGTSPDPTIASGYITTMPGMGDFTSFLQNLLPNTLYYARAFATTVAGTSYGNVISFTTRNGQAVVTTLAIGQPLVCGTVATGTVVDDGGDGITAAGICYGTTPNPTTANQVAYSNDFAALAAELTDLSPNTVYYYRAFATNPSGTFYGQNASFTTPAFSATVNTLAATQVQSCSANIHMNYTQSVANTVDNYGLCYGTVSQPTIDNATQVALSDSLDATLSCLLPNTTYYVRAYVHTCLGYQYGNVVSFTTGNNSVSVVTNTPTVVRACVIELPYCTINVGDSGCNAGINGLVYGTSPNPTSDTGVIALSSGYTLQNLTPNTLYYIRGYATRCDGTRVYGNTLQITTLSTYSSIITNAVTNITAGTAMLNASVISNGIDTLFYGICFDTNPNPTIANTSYYYGLTSSTANIIKPIQGLTANTTYYARVFVHSGTDGCIGISYGNQVSFSTTSGPLVVGQYYNGGIIIKLNSATSGLIAAPTDQGYAAWGCEGVSITGTQSTVGTGQANTTAILAGCSEANTAARMCDSLVLNGKSDWYLPSEQELLLAHQLTYFTTYNYDTISPNAASYWTSSQSSAVQAKIISQTTSGTVNKSDNNVRVRAIRSF